MKQFQNIILLLLNLSFSIYCFAQKTPVLPHLDEPDKYAWDSVNASLNIRKINYYQEKKLRYTAEYDTLGRIIKLLTYYDKQAAPFTKTYEYNTDFGYTIRTSSPQCATCKQVQSNLIMLYKKDSFIHYSARYPHFSTFDSTYIRWTADSLILDSIDYRMGKLTTLKQYRYYPNGVPQKIILLDRDSKTDYLQTDQIYDYDSTGNLLKYVLNRGGELFYTEEITYNQSGQRVQSRKVQDTGSIVTTEFLEYDSFGNRIKLTSLNVIPKSITDEWGDLVDSIYMDTTGLTTETFEYDTLGNLVKHTHLNIIAKSIMDEWGYMVDWKYMDTTEWKYDAKGRIIWYKSPSRRAFVDDEIIYVRYTNDSNNDYIMVRYASNRLTRKKVYTQGGIRQIIEWEYYNKKILDPPPIPGPNYETDTILKLERFVEYDTLLNKKVHEISYESDDKQPNVILSEKYYKYDSIGNLIEEVDLGKINTPFEKSVIYYKYNTEGQLISRFTTGKNGDTLARNYTTYNEQGLMILKDSCREIGKECQIDSFAYDTAGRMIFASQRYISEFFPRKPETYKFTYCCGQLCEVEFFDGDKYRLLTRYTYNSKCLIESYSSFTNGIISPRQYRWEYEFRK